MGESEVKRLKKHPGRIIAIDPSPRGTGIALLDGGVLTGFWFCTEAVGTAKKYERATLIPKVTLPDESARMKRLQVVRDLVLGLCDKYRPFVVGLEDYTFQSGGKGGGTLQIGELGGVLRLALWEAGYRVRTYHPASVKLYWTGRGDAEKEDMIREAVKRMNKGLEIRGFKPNPLLPAFNKLAKTYQEAVSDAFAIGSLLLEEICFRRGRWQLNGAPENIVRVFNRVTDSMPMCLIDRPWLERVGE